jgi:hypothetical protein
MSHITHDILNMPNITDITDITTFHAILLSGRATNWWRAIEGVRRHLIEPMMARTGVDRVLIFASVDACQEDVDRLDDMISAYDMTGCHRESYFSTHDFKGMGTYHQRMDVNHPYFPSMCYHNKMAFSLLQDHLWQNPDERVGWVVYTRPDLMPTEIVDLPVSPEENTLYYLKYGDVYPFCPDFGVPDQFQAGDLETMRRYCSVFDYIHSTSPNMPPPFHCNTYSELELLKYLIHRWRVTIVGVVCMYVGFGKSFRTN